MLSNHPTSMGSIIKRITEINPSLSVMEITAILRRSMEKRASDQFAGSRDEIDEDKALELARATVKTQ